MRKLESFDPPFSDVRTGGLQKSVAVGTLLQALLTTNSLVTQGTTRIRLGEAENSPVSSTHLYDPYEEGVTPVSQVRLVHAELDRMDAAEFFAYTPQMESQREGRAEASPGELPAPEWDY